MRRVLLRCSFVTLVLCVVLGIAACSVFGYSPSYFFHAPPIAAGIGAKLACSLHFVSGYSKSQVAEDIQIYSPLLSHLKYDYDDENNLVTAKFAGFISRRAHFVEGVGCTLEYDDFPKRPALTRPPNKYANELWPLGDRVGPYDTAVQAQLEELLAEDNQQGLQSRAYVVVKNGEIVAESYAQGVNERTPLLGWSMTKTVNALILGRLALEHPLNLEDDHLFSEWDKDERKHIQLRHLLNMTDGLDFREVYQPGADVTNMLFKQADMAQFSLGKKLQHTPGRHFYYSSGSANLLSYYLVKQFNGDSDQALSWIWNEFFAPLGIDSAIYEVDSVGVPVASAYLFATARDWARIGQLMLNEGQLNNQRFYDKRWSDALQSPSDAHNTRAYGFQVWLNRGNESLRWPLLPEDSYAAQGNRKQWLMVFPSQDVVIVRLGWSPGEYPHEANFNKILDSINSPNN